MANQLAPVVKVGSTSLRLPILLTKTADGTEQTGKVAADLTASYWREGGSVTAITVSDLSTLTVAYSSGGWKEADSTRTPGLYRLDVPDAAWTSGVEWVVIAVKCGSDFVYYERYALDAALMTAGNTLAVNAAGRVDLGLWLGSAPDALSSGKLPADLKLWLASAPAALSTNGYVQGMLLRWLTDNAGGTPNALISARIDANAQVVGDKTGYTASTVSDKTGYALTSAYDPAKTASQTGDAMTLTSGERTTLAAVVWNALVSGFTTAGSIGKRLVDYLTGDVFARLGTPAGASLAADVAAVKSDTAGISGVAAAASAAVTSAHGSGSYIRNTEPDNAGIAANASVLATLTTNVALLAARLGAFTGSGLNTVLGFFRALLRKDAALTPTDVGGTYDNTTDSLEAGQEATAGGVTVYGQTGALEWTYVSKDVDGVTLLPGVEVWISSDLAGTNRSASKWSDSLGRTVWHLDAGTVYVWQRRYDRVFGGNPDLESVSA